MPKVFDYRDSKVLIIWLLSIVIGTGGTLYAKDQSYIKEKQFEISNAAKSDKAEIVKLIKETAEAQKRRDDKYRYFFRDEMAKFQKTQKTNSDNINLLIIDMAVRKALNEEK